MSRFTIITEKYKITYGFDRPLGEYFVQVFNKAGVLIKEDTTRVGVFTYLTDKELEGVIPREHTTAIALDLPF
jgi:hypothetical protein